MKLTLFVLLGGALFAAILWIGAHTEDYGFLKRETETASKSALSHAANASPTLGVGIPDEPTPTPLPPHFPDVSQDDLNAAHKAESMTLTEAFETCWQGIQNLPDTKSGDMTVADMAAFFGRLKRNEILEKNDGETKLGLIFEPVVFPAGAAGTATEVDGKIREFQVRANGHILHCGAAGGPVSDNCRCL